MNHYVKSNYERRAGDFYPTVDDRCIVSLVEHFGEEMKGGIVDVCAPDGSGIVDIFTRLGYKARGWPDAFQAAGAGEGCAWIVTNPPYTRPLVDRIITRQIERVEAGEFVGLAVLLRAGFDFSKSRAWMFGHRLYLGQVRMRFRPWWTEERNKQPIHNYVWHVWVRDFGPVFADYSSVVYYSNG